MWIRASPPDAAAAESLFRQIVSGVGAAYARGIIHRDLKPQNVLAAEAKVADFGFGRQEGAERMTRTGVWLGTSVYMPPSISALSASTTAPTSGRSAAFFVSPSPQR